MLMLKKTTNDCMSTLSAPEGTKPICLVRRVMIWAVLIATASMVVACASQKPAGPEKHYRETGLASYYAHRFHGRRTASGETYLEDRLTAAHRWLPFGTRLKVTNLTNGRKVYVRVNDRGPFIKGRIIDLSNAAAQKIDMIDQGIVKVTVEEIE